MLSHKLWDFPGVWAGTRAEPIGRLLTLAVEWDKHEWFAQWEAELAAVKGRFWQRGGSTKRGEDGERAACCRCRGWVNGRQVNIVNTRQTGRDRQFASGFCWLLLSRGCLSGHTLSGMFTHKPPFHKAFTARYQLCQSSPEVFLWTRQQPLAEPPRKVKFRLSTCKKSY